MAEIAIFILVVVGLSCVGLVLFAAYLGITALRLLGRVVGGTLRGVWRLIFGRREPRQVTYVCPRPACGEENPGEARYCRRCGRVMERVSGVEACRHRVPPPIPCGRSGRVGQVVLSSWRR